MIVASVQGGIASGRAHQSVVLLHRLILTLRASRGHQRRTRFRDDPAHANHLSSDVAVQPPVQDRIGHRRRHGNHMAEREGKIQGVGTHQMRIELGEEVEAVPW